MMGQIGVIGIGRIGLCVSLILESFGYNVIGIDIDEVYVKSLNQKTFQTMEPLATDYLRKSVNFVATTDLKKIHECDYLFIYVQTPNGGTDNFYDHSIMSTTLDDLRKMDISNTHVIIGSTVLPGYIDNVASCLLKDCQNVTISYHPEFISQGNIIYDILNSNMCLLGTNDIGVETFLREIYDKISPQAHISVTTPIEAEITKIAINTYITTKISFANMIGDLCDEIGARKDVVCNAMSTDERIGPKYFNAGLSYGGPCFPRDTLAFKQLLENYGLDPCIVESTHKYNKVHNDLFTNKIALSTKDQPYVIFENVNYKNDTSTNIITDSAKLYMAKKLQKGGKRVIIKDLWEIVSNVKKEYGNIFEYDVIE